jgi:hypothetical protein
LTRDESFLWVVSWLFSLFRGVPALKGRREFPSDDSSFRTYEGRLQAVEMTSYMYGSRVLLTREERFAVGGDVSLKNYEGKNVSVRGTPVEGYPVDGGTLFNRSPGDSISFES